MPIQNLVLIKDPVENGINSFFMKISILELKLYMNSHWMVCYKVGMFMWIRNLRWIPMHELIYSKGRYGIVNTMYKFIFDNTYLIEPKLYINGHWMVPYKVAFFNMNLTFIMATTT